MMFAKVVWWIWAASLVLQIGCLAFCDYPREETRAGDFVNALIVAALVIWGARVLW